MAAPFLQSSFSKGEIAPSLWGHVDLAAWHVACTTLRNMYVGFRGGAYSRAGTRFVGFSKQRPDLGDPPPRIIEWDFNVNQDYVLEFGDHYLRFVFAGGQVTEDPIAITLVTQSNPANVTTAIAHGYAPGDWVNITGVSGMTQINGGPYIVLSTGLTATSFDISNADGVAIDSTLFSPYTAGGEVARIYEIVSPYAAVDLPYLKFTQSAGTRPGPQREKGVMSLTLVNAPTGAEYPPYDLKRFGPTDWTLTPTDFGASIAAPGGINVSATTQPNPAFSPPTLPAAYAYEVTAIDAVTGQESEPSPVGNVVNGVDMAATAGSNVINWAQVGNALYYNIYRAPTSFNTDPGNPNIALPVPAGALFGFVGSSFGTQFVDSNITPDVAITPPLHQDPFAPGQILAVGMTGTTSDWTHATVTITTATGSGFMGQAVIVNNQIVSVIVTDQGRNYLPSDLPVFTGDGTGASAVLSVSPQTGTFPGVVSYFQERRVYAQTLNAPDEYWMSQPGNFTNFDTSIPTVASDALSGTPWSEKVDGIQWMISMPLGELSFTASGVWQIGPSGTFASSPAAISPSNQLASPQSSIGSSPTVPPIRVNWDVIYLEYMSSSVLDLAYQIFFNIYAGTDISWSSSHLLSPYTILQWAYARTPNRIIWSVRNDGTLLSLTYVKEQEVVGWSRHDTQGQWRSLCHCNENPVDAIYLVAERPVTAGGTRYFIERMDNRLWPGIEQVWCVDAGVATPLTTPNATLFANTSSGVVAFNATAPVFSSANIGSTIRAMGGSAVIQAFGSATQVTGLWITPAAMIYPNDPNEAVIPAQAGSWSIAPQVTTVSGLSHLAGRQVVGIADGVPIGPLIVSALGTVNLPFAASYVVLGLQFTAQLQTIYLDTGQPTIQGRRRAVYDVTARIEGGALPQLGANQQDSATVTWPNLTQTLRGDVDPPLATYQNLAGQTVEPLFIGDVRAVVSSDWNKRGQLAVQQTLPIPLQVTALMSEALPGDTPEVQITPRQPPQQGRGG